MVSNTRGCVQPAYKLTAQRPRLEAEKTQSKVKRATPKRGAAGNVERTRRFQGVGVGRLAQQVFSMGGLEPGSPDSLSDRVSTRAPAVPAASL